MCLNLSIGWDGVSAIATAVTAVIAAKAASSASKSARSVAVSGQMQTYLVQYLAALPGLGAAHSLSEYERLDGTEQTRANIVAGLLVELVEAMTRARDPRAREWREFITGMQGPLMTKSGFDLKSYASSEEMKQRIADWQAGKP